MSYHDLEASAEKVVREVRYLQALVLVNLVYGAVALGIPISAVIAAVSPAFSMGLSALDSVLTLKSMGTIILAAIILSLVPKWFIHSAEVFDAVEDLEKARNELITAQDTDVRDELVIRLIVELLSIYRQHQGSIRAFRVLGKASGLLFIGLGLLSLVQTLLVSPANMTQAVLNLAATIPTGLAGVYISHSLAKYQDAWDPRLIASSEAEEELKRLLERP